MLLQGGSLQTSASGPALPVSVAVMWALGEWAPLCAEYHRWQTQHGVPGDGASVHQGVVQNRDSTTHTDGLGLQR